MAQDINLNPIVTAYNAFEYVVKANPSKYPSGLSKEQEKKFQDMLKQDFYKDDLYRDMWNKDWIYK
jgi:ABC-type Zn uptake system ZnuABC Zn-binding protein ZnuA